MTAAHAPTRDIQQDRRPPWIVLVDAALPVVLVFWMLVDSGTSMVARLGHSAATLN